MKGKLKQLGQGMTEYIIIVALIAVAAITAYGFFGDTIRGQVGALSKEVSGQDGSGSVTTAQGAADQAEADGAKNKNLGTFTE